VIGGARPERSWEKGEGGVAGRGDWEEVSRGVRWWGSARVRRWRGSAVGGGGSEPPRELAGVGTESSRLVAVVVGRAR